MKRTDNRKALAGKNAAELQTELEALLKEQFGLRMQAATQQLTNTAKLKDVRRGIARVRTLLGEKEGMSEAGKANTRRAGASRLPAGDNQALRISKSKQGASAAGRKRASRPAKNKQGARA